MLSLNETKLTQAIIDGPMNHTAYSIWKYLRQDKLDAAISEFRSDSDKLNGTLYKKLITDIFIHMGCKLY